MGSTVIHSGAKLDNLIQIAHNVEVGQHTVIAAQAGVSGSTKIGKNVFINFDCVFLDLGGITIEDNVLLAPKVSLLTESHPLDPAQRQSLIPKPILIKKNAWIGPSATILPGVTIGENAVVAAGSVVTKDVPDNVVVAGIPATFIKKIK